MKVIVRAAAGACKCHWSLAFVFFPSPLPFPLSVHLFTDNVLFSASPDTSAFIAVTSNSPSVPLYSAPVCLILSLCSTCNVFVLPLSSIEEALSQSCNTD